MAESNGETKERFQRVGLDPFEATLETGRQVGWAVTQTGLRGDPELVLGLRAGRTVEGRKPEVLEKAEVRAVVVGGMRGLREPIKYPVCCLGPWTMW